MAWWQELAPVLVFILGLTVGSFLNVCIYRMPINISVVTPRSNCPYCKQQLGVFDLIPVLSYLVLKGKCRYCNEKISVCYPLVELGCGFVFLVLFYKFSLTIRFLTMAYLISGLVVVALIDYRHKIIPDIINLILFIGALPLLALQSLLVEGLLSGMFGFGVLFLIALLSKGAMGGGDIKLAGVLGLYLGWPGIFWVLLLAFIIGSVIGLSLMVCQRVSIKTAIPFGPFLSIAALLVMLWETEISSVYWQMFGLY